MMGFYKVQSLGNDFVLFDHLNSPADFKLTPDQIKKVCDRHFGIGADGVLVVARNGNDVDVKLFNADGSAAEKCYNGLRCVAWHLHTQHHFPKKFHLKMSGHFVEADIDGQFISINVGNPKYIRKETIEIKNKKITGHIIDVGNPHFVILEKIDLDELKQIGALIENHPVFPNKTNVGFVWKENDDTYNLLVHERGCGITQACGTGCAAAIKTLAELNEISKDKPYTINMLGGKLITHINKKNEIIQKATAELVFTGSVF
jgi:diaminopimelate epimerase